MTLNESIKKILKEEIDKRFKTNITTLLSASENLKKQVVDLSSIIHEIGLEEDSALVSDLTAKWDEMRLNALKFEDLTNRIAKRYGITK